MKKLKELRARRGKIADEMQALVDAGLDVDDNRAKFDALKAEAADVKADIERLEALADEVRSLDTPPAPPVPDGIAPTPGLEMGDPPRFRSFEENVGAILRASLNPHLPVDERLQPNRAETRDASQLGEGRAATGLGTQVPSDGGFFIQSEYAPNLLDPMFETGLISSRTQQHTITNPAAQSVEFLVLDETSRAAGSRLGGIRLYTRDEAETVTATKSKWRKWEVKTVPVMGLCYVTQEMLDDVSGVVQRIESYFNNEAGFDLDDWVIRGDGASQPEGILNSDCFITQAKETGQTADTIVTDNLDKMWARLPAKMRRNAVWTVNGTCWPQLFSLERSIGTGGVPLLTQNGVAGGPLDSIYRREVLELEQSPTLGDANDVMFIDPQQYMLVRKGGVRTDLSMHVRFIYGEVVIRFMFRVGGGCWWKSAITPYKGADTLGPFVGLAERA